MVHMVPLVPMVLKFEDIYFFPIILAPMVTFVTFLLPPMVPMVPMVLKFGDIYFFPHHFSTYGYVCHVFTTPHGHGHGHGHSQWILY